MRLRVERGRAYLAEDDLRERVERQDRAIRTMAKWLFESHAGFGVQDVEAIGRILDGESWKVER